MTAILAATLSVPAFADSVDTMKSFTVDKKNEAVAYGKKMMKAADRDIKKLERSASKASDDTKAQFAQDAKDIKATRDAAAKELDKMGKASGEAWDSTKTAFADAYKDLQEGVANASKKLKK
jgi:hypothetical protein